MGGPRPEHGARSLWYQDLTPVILRPLRFYVANDKRCLPQAVSTAERAELWGERVEPMRAQMLVLGAIGRRPGFHHEALEYGSVTLLSLLSLRPLRSTLRTTTGLYRRRSLPQSARREKGNPHLGESSGVVLA